MIRRKHSTSELDLLTEKEKALRDEMDRLEAYLQGGAEQERVDQINTMPAPDELAEARRQTAFVEQVLSKKEIRNIKRHQTKGLLLFVLLALAVLSLGSWVYQAYAEYFL